MESKKMTLVLIATFALAAFASAAIEKDVITADAINALSKSNKFPNEVINALSNTKTMVPNLFLAETFLKPNAAHTDASVPCGESCVYIPCFTKAIGCSCRSKVCYRG